VRPIPSGATAELEVVITPEMTVLFDRLGAVHPVYATYRMAQHFEEAGRLLLLRYLEPDEDAVGRAVAVEHLAPARLGDVVRIEARCTGLDRSRVSCTCRAVDAEGRELGSGSTVQVVMAADLLRARLGT
jgi:fluoroacetyl-CoA thioesterase